MRLLTTLACVLAVSAVTSLAQVRHVPLDERIDGAAIIVEGRVVASRTFLNRAGTMIHTAHRIEASKVFKPGTVALGDLREIVVVTPGGRLGNRWHVVQPSLSLSPGDTGVFFLDVRPGHAGLDQAFVPHASTQGLVRYRGDGSGFDPFNEYADVARDLHPRIRTRTGQSFVELAPRPLQEAGGGGGETDSHSISSLSPGTVRGGIQDVLTINGSGFGTFTGSATVLFDDPNDGLGGSFGPVDPEHVVSWTDTQIQVRVPGRLSGSTAGTGKVIVRDSAGVDAVSPGDATVEYALVEVLSGGVLYRVKLIDENVRGGYTYEYSTATANGGVDFTSVTGAVDRFEDAVETWNCATGWTVDVDGTTSVQADGDDGVNIVAFDNDADPLPTGVLGLASSFYSSCGGDTWRVDGIDIRFKRDGTDGVDWYYGANPAGQGPAEDDFESVAVHELGHNVQHGHINDASDVMYFSIAAGTNKRTLSSADTNGGLEIVSHSGAFSGCGDTGMLSFDCSAPPTVDFVGSPLGACGSSLAVDFTDTSRNGPTSWSWAFGDTNVSSARNPSHTYTSQGLFTVSLDASNANGMGSESKDDYIVVTDAPAAPSCSPAFVGHDNCCAIGITNVTFNTIDRTTGTPTDGDALEEDFTCTDFTVLQASTSYSVSITTGPSNVEDVEVYVDWNGDGTLSGGELEFSSNDTLTNHSGMITAPSTAVRDTALRMRVLSDFGPQNIGSPCENIEFGQVENYSVIVAADAPAGAPGAVPDTSLTLTKNVNPSLIDFTWGASCGPGVTDYTIHEGTIGMFYDHTRVVCSTGGATSYNGLSPMAGQRYFLVAPVSATDEGSYGMDSTPTERPVSTTTCISTQDTSACP